VNILPQNLVERNTQVRHNLWLTSTGAVVGYGPILAPNGLTYCFTCGTDECTHVQQCDDAWQAGTDSVRWCDDCWAGRHCGSCVCCSSAIPFDGIAPDNSSDESSETARLGLPVEW
jgi:hypothetical protein